MRLKFTEFSYFQGECQGFSNGQRTIRKALERQNVDIVYNSDIELQHLSAHLYHRNCKKSFIMPTHETDDIHPKLISKMNEADNVIALCEHNEKVFENNGVKIPITVCKQGIDLNIFKYQDRSREDVLKFLWIGQTSIRKGWDLVSDAFQKAFGNMKDVRLYIKTNGKGKQEVIDIGENVVFDSRNLALADMLDIYYDNNIFVFPSRGEATGLTALEAMATGLICMAPSIGGMQGFINDFTAIPLDFEMIDAEYGVKTKVPNVKIDDLIAKLRYVYEFYDEIKGHTGVVSDFIKTNYCVNKMANKLVKILFGGN